MRRQPPWRLPSRLLAQGRSPWWCRRPARSLVFDATSRSIWAPMFSNLSSNSISLATDTPSLVRSKAAPHGFLDPEMASRSVGVMIHAWWAREDGDAFGAPAHAMRVIGSNSTTDAAMSRLRSTRLSSPTESSHVSARREHWPLRLAQARAQKSTSECSTLGEISAVCSSVHTFQEICHLGLIEYLRSWSGKDWVDASNTFLIVRRPPVILECIC